MRTSGKGGADIFMMTVPLAILILYGVMSNGGIGNVLHLAEVTLQSAVAAVMSFFS